MFEFVDFAPDVRQKLAELVLYHYNNVSDDDDIVGGDKPRVIIQSAIREYYDSVFYNGSPSTVSEYDAAWAMMLAFGIIKE